MNILYISQNRPHSHGNSSQIRALQQIKGLLRKGKTVYSLFQENDSLFLYEGEELIQGGQDNIYQKKTAAPYFGAIKSFLFKRYPLSVSMHSFPEVRRVVKHIMSEVLFDVVHIQSKMLHNFPDIDRWPIPVVVDYVDAISLNLERRYIWTNRFIEKAAVKGEIGRVKKYEEYVNHFGTKGLVTSRADRFHLDPVKIERIDVVPNYLDSSSFTNDLYAPKKKAIIFTGDMSQMENMDAATRLVHDIFPVLKSEFSELECWIGAKQEHPALEKLQKAAGVQIIQGKRNIEDRIKQAAVYVCPLRFGNGQQTNVLEAAALGCPIVLSDVGNEGIELTEEREMEVARSTEQFILKTSMLIQHRMKSLLRAHHARSYVRKQFSESSIMDQLIQAYIEADGFYQGRQKGWI